MRLDPKAAAVDLSRAAKQWQSIGEAKIAAGRNPEDRDLVRRLSSLLDAVAPFRQAEALWVETAAQLRELGSTEERSAAVADKQAATCGRQREYCGESFHEFAMQIAHHDHLRSNLILSRIAAYEFERQADSRPVEWLIRKFLDDPVLGRRESWGGGVDLWWLSS